MKSSNFDKRPTPFIVVTAALLTLLCGASTVVAQQPVRTQHVRFQDLNMASPQGAQALYARIHAAALKVCSESDPVYRSAATICARKAELNAVNQVNSPQLTAYYQGLNKKSGHNLSLAAAR